MHTGLVIDLRKLSHMVTVARKGSYSAAADAIPMSQSALSRSIQSLEAQYDIVIFERGRSGAQLTKSGRAFYEVAQQLLRRAGLLEDEIAELRSGRGKALGIGLGPITAASFLPKLLHDVLSDFPESRVSIRVGSNSLLRTLLLDGEIEFYIGGLPPAPDFYSTSTGLSVRRLVRPAPALLVRPDHPLLSSDLAPAAVARYPVVAGTYVRETLASSNMRELGMQRPTIELDDFDVLASLVQSSDAILVANDVFASARADFGLKHLPLTIAAKSLLEYALVSLADEPLSPIAEEIADHLLGSILSYRSTAT